MESLANYHLVDIYDIKDSPTTWIVKGTGRARCRLCGEKVVKGDDAIAFFFSIGDGTYNSWKAIEGKAHTSCLPHGWKIEVGLLRT